MLTFTEVTKTERTLETPEQIVEHVAAEFDRRRDAAAFKFGDRVRLLRRDGVPPQFVIGDVGVVVALCDTMQSQLCMLLCANETGMIIQYPVAIRNLEKIA